MLQVPRTPGSSRFLVPWEDELPLIDSSEPFTTVVSKLIDYISKLVDAAYTYEQLRTTFAGQSLRPLIQSLSDDCHHPALVAALLAAKYEYASANDEGTGLSQSRGLACEIVAWQFLTYLAESELIEHLLYELPQVSKRQTNTDDDVFTRSDSTRPNPEVNENTSLLGLAVQDPGSNSRSISKQPKSSAMTDSDGTLLLDTPKVDDDDDLAHSMAGMNALEIAGIANAKKFLSQRPVQKILDDIWNGNVVFWESMSVQAVKKPRKYNKKVADPFTRLRVPKYQKAFQIAFFVSFLILYYAVLVERNPERVTFTEVLLYLWIASYAYDEFGEIQDAGVLFYRIDFWSLWDVAIIGVGAAFILTRIIGLAQHSDYIIDMSFDVLSVVAVFLVPRICSVMSLNPYFGSLIPVLKEMTLAFCNFLPVILVLYLGFLTTFTMLARDRKTLSQMSWILVKVFFGSSYLGFDEAVTISPALGYPLMLVFVTLTNILLLTALISLVSNSLTEVMAHAREEYYFQYSIYVLESSTSRRMTYFQPPLNLIPLLLLRPLRLILPSDTVRRIRILTLKATHVGFVAVIWAYEGSRRFVSHNSQPPSARTPRAHPPTPRPLSAGWHPGDYEQNAGRAAMRTTIGKATTNNAANESASGTADTELVKLVQKLSSQVDELTAMVAGQKKD